MDVQWWKPVFNNHIQMNELENQQINSMCCDTESEQATGALVLTISAVALNPFCPSTYFSARGNFTPWRLL